jgi:hypothetical protein
MHHNQYEQSLNDGAQGVELIWGYCNSGNVAIALKTGACNLGKILGLGRYRPFRKNRTGTLAALDL